jgi:hypothetical protein
MDQHHGPVPDALARRQLHLHRLQPVPAVPGDAEQQGAARAAGQRLHFPVAAPQDTPRQLVLRCADQSAVV